MKPFIAPHETPQEIAECWGSMDAFIFAGRYPDSWINHARRDIPNLLKWLKTEQEMHAAWRKRAEEAEAELERLRGERRPNEIGNRLTDAGGMTKCLGCDRLTASVDYCEECLRKKP